MRYGTISQLKACLYGGAVGDALGVPYEFSPRGTFHATSMTGHGTHDQPAGTWSDDTSMTLATLDSLLHNDWRVDVDDIRRRFIDWRDHDAYTPVHRFDIGGTVATALRAGHGCAGLFDNGNGALMRIMPLAFTDTTDDDIRAASAVTHAHRISMDECVAFVHELRTMLAGGPPPDAYETTHLKGLPQNRVRSGGYVKDTHMAALWCVANTRSYRDCVLAAVNLGDDTDTTGMVAGVLAGALYGFDAIPHAWTAGLRGRDIIDGLLERAAS